MGLKIKVDDKGRVPPEVMRLLIEFAEHRDLCAQCKQAFQTSTLDYCATGHALLTDLCAQPGVEEHNDADTQGS